MKDYKIMFAAAALGLSVLIIGLFTVSVFNYIAFLKEQNYTLLENINSSISQLKNSVLTLQSRSRVREMSELKSENINLRREAERLRRQVRGGKDMPQDEPEFEDRGRAGNRGYISGGD